MPNTRIAIFTNQFPGKVSTFFSRDIYTLIQEDYKIDIFPVYPIDPKNWSFVPEKYRESIRSSTNLLHITPLHFYTIDPGLRNDIHTILKESIKYGKTQYAKSLYVIRQAVLWARLFEDKYDLMLSYWGNYAATYAYLANKSCKVSIPFSFFLHAGTDLYRDQIFLEQKISYAKNIFTVCEFNKCFLKKLYPKSYDAFKGKIYTHHLGIDFQEIKYHPFGRDSFTLLTIGSLSPQKGYINAIRALALLQQEFKKINLIVIGEGSEKKHLEKEARELGVIDKIKFINQLPFEQVVKYLYKATLLIHPSSSLGDAVPTVIKEALAAGLPVVGSNIVGIPELLDFGNAGVLFPPNDYYSLAIAIRTLMQDDRKRYQLAENGRSYAEKNFDMWKNSERFIQQLTTKT